MMMKGLFVVGTDTGVGKTVLSAALMAAAGPQTTYWKPVQTGLATEPGDTPTVATLSQLPPERLLDAGPRLMLPASPHHAAVADHTSIDLDTLAATGRAHDAPDRRWVVEGAGGLLVPLSDTQLLTDLVAALALPVLVAASTRLGTINHTLLTLRHLATLALPTLGVVLVGPPDSSADSALAAHAPGAVLGHLPHLDPLTPDAVRAAGQTLLAAAPALRQALS